MRKTLLFSALFSVVFLAFVSCEKEGPAGPAGPTGAAGAAGAQGPGGAAGAPGAAGTPANVIYSAWLTSPYASRDTTIDGSCVRVRHIVAPSLSASILSSGLMLTYFRIGSIGPYALPYVSDAGGATNQIAAIYAQQKIFFIRHTYNTCRFTGATPETYPGQPVMISLPQSLEFRYVLVPGLVSGGKLANGSAMTYKGYTEDQLKKMPYDKVSMLLNIPSDGASE